MTNEEIKAKAEKLHKILNIYMEYLSPPEGPSIYFPQPPPSEVKSARESIRLKHLTDDPDVRVIAHRISSIVFQQAKETMASLAEPEICMEAIKELAEFQNDALYKEWFASEEEAERQSRSEDID